MNRALPLLLAAAALLVSPAPVAADEGDMDIQLLRPTFAPWGLLSTPGARPGRQWTVRAGVILQYERGPLVVINQVDEIAKVVSDRVRFDVGGNVTLLDNFGVGLSIPLYAQSGNFLDFPVPGFALGDLRLDVAYRLLDIGYLAVAIRSDFHFPTSTKNAFAGERLPRIAPAAVAEFGIPQISGVVELNGMIRQRVSSGFDLHLGVELGVVLGLKAWAVRDKLLVMAEFSSRASTLRFLSSASENPVELRAGVRFFPIEQLGVDIAVGAGLNAGYGTSLPRVLLGVTYRRLPPFVEEPEIIPEEEMFADIPEDDIPEDPPPEPEPEPEPEPVLAELIEGEDRIEIKEPIGFEFNSDVLLPESFPVLDEVFGILKERGDIAFLLVEGHASFEGKVDYNWDLSNRRAASVFRYLVENGVNVRRISYRGMGEAVPTVGGADEAALDQNRRVEFRILHWVDVTGGEPVPDWDLNKPPVPWLMPEPEDSETGAPVVPEVEIVQPDEGTDGDQR